MANLDITHKMNFVTSLWGLGVVSVGVHIQKVDWVWNEKREAIWEKWVLIDIWCGDGVVWIGVMRWWPRLLCTWWID